MIPAYASKMVKHVFHHAKITNSDVFTACIQESVKKLDDFGVKMTICCFLLGEWLVDGITLVL